MKMAMISDEETIDADAELCVYEKPKFCRAEPSLHVQDHAMRRRTLSHKRMETATGRMFAKRSAPSTVNPLPKRVVNI